MKRRLAVILVLAMLVTALSGIAIFSSAADPAAADYYRMLVGGYDMYRFNPKLTATTEAYDLDKYTGVMIQFPTVTVALNAGVASFTITGDSGTVYTSADMAALAAVLNNGDYVISTYNNRDIPGLKNVDDGYRYIRFDITTALTAAAGDASALAAIKAQFEALFTALKAINADLDGVITTTGDAATLDEVVGAALLSSYPSAALTADSSYASKVWQDMGGSSNIDAAGTNSYYDVNEALPTGFTPDTYLGTNFGKTSFQHLMYDVIKIREISDAGNGRVFVEFIEGPYTTYGTNAPEAEKNAYQQETVIHAGLLNAQHVYIGVTGGASRQNNVAWQLPALNNLVGFEDRQPIVLPFSWNDDFLISGMNAGGRNVWRITFNAAVSGMNKENFLVSSEGDLTFAINGQTITFPGGSVISGVRADPQYGYWVETATDVAPTVSYEEGRYASMREPNITSYDFNYSNQSVPYNYAPAWWSVTGEAVKDVAFSGGVLKLSGTSGVVHNYLTTVVGMDKVDFGIEVSVTLPQGVLPMDSEIQILRPMNSSNVAHYNGIILCNGKLYYNTVGGDNMMTMNENLVAGGTYKFRTIYTATTSKPVCDFYVTKADGTIVAYAEDIAVPSCRYTLYWHRVGFDTVNLGENTVVIDDYRAFTINPDVATDLSIYDAATGALITDTATPSATDLGYRYTWTNITTVARKVWLMAQRYDAEGVAIGEPELVKEIPMAGDADGVVTGIVPAGEGSVRLYLRYENKWVGDLYCDETGYDYEPTPNAVPLSGTNVTFKYSATIDGEFKDWAEVAPLPIGTGYFKAYAEGNADYAELESEPVAFEVVFAHNSWLVEPTCHGVSYGQTVNPIAVPKFGTAEDVVFLYSTERNGVYTEEVPTDIGTYWVKAYVAEMDVCYEMMSEPITFTIFTGEQNLNIINVPEGYILYGDVFDLDVTGAAGEGALIWEITRGADYATIDEDGVVTITGVGTITVTVTKEGDDFHNGGSASVTFTTLKNIPPVEAPAGLTGVYGDTLATVELPAGWVWLDENAVLSSLGVNYFTAIYTDPEMPENYEIVTMKVAVEVSAAVNEWTTEVSIDGWAYGAEPNAPMGIAKFGNVVFTYSDAEDGEYTATVPTEAGTYWLKAVVYSSSKYNALAAKVQFTISTIDQEAITITGKPEATIIYGDTFTLGVAGGSGTGTISWAVTSGNEFATIDENGNVVITGVGEVTITATKAADNNYNEITETYTFTTAKAPTTVTAPEGLTTVFGSDLSAVVLPEGWAWADGTVKVGNVGDNTFVAIFTPADAVNFETVELDVTVAVTALDASDATIADLPKVELTEGGAEVELVVTLGDTVLVLGTDYTVAYTNNTAVGTATATVTFIGNYAGTVSADYKVICAEHTAEELTDCTKDRLCTVCGEVAVAAGEHTFGEWVTDAESHWKACADCGAIADKAEHIAEELTDCTKDRLCTVCGEVAIAAGEHTWDEGKISEADDETKGMMVYTCTVCGATKVEANHGDNTNLVLMTTLAVVSATALAAVLYIGKKRNAF